MKNTKTEAFRVALESSVGTLVKDAKAFQARIEETALQAIAFAVAHGRTTYLNQLVIGLPANMAATVIDIVDAFNRKAVASMVVPDKQSEILSVITDDTARASGHVIMFAKTRDEGYVIGKSDASKVARRIIGESFESEEAMVTAMTKMVDHATETAENRRTAAFNESNAVVRFRDNHVKNIAKSGAENAAEHAFSVAVTLNTLITDPALRKTEPQLKSMIAGAMIAANQTVPEEYKAFMPKVTLPNVGDKTPETESKTEEVKGEVPEGAKRGRKAA